MTLPSLFLAHGSPDLPYSHTPARAFTESRGAGYPGLRAILVISAHWEARLPMIGTARAPETIYDFGGFDARDDPVIESPRVYRRVVCSTTKRPYRVSSSLHRTSALLLRVGCSRLGQEGGGCWTNRSISGFPIRPRA